MTTRHKEALRAGSESITRKQMLVHKLNGYVQNGSLNNTEEMKKENDKKGLSWIERTVLKVLIKKVIKYIDKNMKGSWKTSLAGWGTLIAGIILAIVALFDGDPATKPDTEQIQAALTALGITIPAWLGFLFARDNDKTSEDVRAK